MTTPDEFPVARLFTIADTDHETQYPVLLSTSAGHGILVISVMSTNPAIHFPLITCTQVIHPGDAVVIGWSPLSWPAEDDSPGTPTGEVGLAVADFDPDDNGLGVAGHFHTVDGTPVWGFTTDFAALVAVVQFWDGGHEKPVEWQWQPHHEPDDDHSLAVVPDLPESEE